MHKLYRWQTRFLMSLGYYWDCFCGHTILWQWLETTLFSVVVEAAIEERVQMVEEANWDCCNFPFSSYWWRSLEKSGQKVRKQWQQQQSVSLWLFLWKVEASGFYCFQYTILSLSGQRSILPTKVRDFRNELNLNFLCVRSCVKM